MDRSVRDTADQQFLQVYLAERDELCPLCDYNLRGLTGAHCPECGKKLIIRVGLEDPVLKAFVVGLVGLASFFGFSMLTLVWLVGMTVILGPGAPDSVWLLLLVMSVVSGLLLLAWIRNAPRVRRMSRNLRIALAALCLLAPVAGVGAFIFWFVQVVD